MVKKLTFFVLKFILEATRYCVGSPIVAFIEPFKPVAIPFLRMIFKIPAVPSASYLADGEVITSTLSMASAGNWRNASVPLKPTNAEGLPSINILTFSLPLRLTFPSTSTSTEGTLSKTSDAEPPLTVMSLPTL